MFEGRAALIFGGGRNIGREVAREFARRAGRVAVADRDEEGAHETAAIIRDAGGEAIAIACDVLDTASVRDAVTEAERGLGGIDILMNNAGLLHSGNPQDIPLGEWERMFGVNVFGMVRAIEVVLPKMLARGNGHIVNTASVAGLYPYAANRIPYAASKAAVVSMSENLALYAEPKGVRVSCLCPGPIMSDSMGSMKVFSEQVTMFGPGSELVVKSQQSAARTLADGMAAGRIIIPTHEETWETIRDRASGPDDFIRAKASAMAAGDPGMPRYDPALLAETH